MKKLFQINLLLILAVIWFGSCKKDENQIFYLGGTTPVLSADKTNVVLSADKENETAIGFKWTNPNYQFTTGLSSHDVVYTIEFNTKSDFTDPKTGVLTVSKDLFKNVTVFDLNKVLAGDMGLPFSIPATVYARVVSSIRFEGSENAKLPSNVVSFRTTPYPPPPKVEVPAEGNLWVVGDATNMGWDINIPTPYDVSLKFTKISNTLYEGTFSFKGGGAFKLVQEKGNWGSQYHKLDPGTWDKGEFRKRDSEPGFSGPPDPGNYKMTVNFQEGKYTMVKI